MVQLIEMLQWLIRNPGPLNDLSFCWEVLAFKNLNQLLSELFIKFVKILIHSYMMRFFQFFLGVLGQRELENFFK
jgi:hypothetical protein